MRLLKRYLGPYVPMVVLVVLLKVAQVVADLFLPTLNARIINEGIVKGDTALIWRVAGLMLIITAAAAFSAVLSNRFGARNATCVGRDLRAAVFTRVQSFSPQDIDSFGAPGLINRTNNDVLQVQNALVMMQSMMIMAPVHMVGGAVMAFRQDVGLSTALLVVIPLMLCIIAVVMAYSLPLFKENQSRIDRITGVMREKLAGVRVIRAFVRTDYESRRFEEVNTAQADLNRKINRVMSLMMPVMMLLMNGTVIAALSLGGLRINEGALEPGNLTAFISYAMQILISVMFAVMFFVMIPRASASAVRIREVLDREPSIVDLPGLPPVRWDASRGIELQDVSFAYPGAEAEVLKDISFALQPGKTVAVVGATGSGKSTLALLCMRFYEVTAGEIRAGGERLSRLPLTELRRHIGYVPQKAFLFSGTVRSNLCFGKPDATDEELWQALDIAQARDFVEAMPGGLDAEIVQGGQNVSGGQRQRLSIARALVPKPDILIFDDCFSALDFATDSRLRAALKPLLRDRACLIVAQRVSTILHADCILVLDEGRMVGKGRHEELLTSCAVYAETVDSQMGGREAAV